MPTNRKRRTRTIKKHAIDPAEIYFLQYGTNEGGPPYEHLKIEFFMRRKGSDRWKPIWEEVREEIMPGWTKKHPCTRPWAWWKFDAPQEPVEGWNHERWNSAQRKRLGGTGTPAHEVTCSWGGFDKGIPNGWVNEWQVEYYNGRAKDIHGNKIGCDFKEGDFLGKAIDPNNPPRFESEAAYLQRHGLLTEPELKYLSRHPELLIPEIVEFEEETDGKQQT